MLDVEFDPYEFETRVAEKTFIDKYRGNFVKLDRYGRVSVVYHGDTRLTREERRKMYPSSYDHKKGEDVPVNFTMCQQLDRDAARLNIGHYQEALKDAKTEQEKAAAEV